MDRGIKDEAFVRRALQEADFDMGRWIANQACFNNAATDPMGEVARAAVITSVAIYNQKYGEVITNKGTPTYFLRVHIKGHPLYVPTTK